jgi:hypothetical protein
MVRHVMKHVVKPNGRLIVFVGAEEADQRRVERSLAGCGYAVSGRAERPHGKDARLVVRLLWFDGAG